MLSSVNTGDTAWILTCSVLMLLAIPGLALFYAGLLGRKNILTILSPSFLIVSLVTLEWVLFGYSLAFGPDHNGWIGTLAWAGLRGVGAEPNLEYAGTVPHLALMLYRGMFALAAPAIFLGPFAERLKRGAFAALLLLWSIAVYDPIAHWAWGVGGFLRNSGVLDFAGGAVLHLSAAMAALAMTLFFKRSPDPAPAPDNAPPCVSYALLGAGLFWLAAFGLSAGNSFSAGDGAANAFAMAQIAAAAAGFVWFLLDRLLRQELSPLGLLTGSLAGLIAISPAAGFVNLWGALGIGTGAAVFCYLSLVFLRKKFGLQDSLYAIGLFGVGGLWGTIATGLWANNSVNQAGADGLFYGNPGQLLIQVKATLSIALYSFGMSYLLVKIVDLVIGLRPRPEISPVEP